MVRDNGKSKGKSLKKDSSSHHLHPHVNQSAPVTTVNTEEMSKVLFTHAVEIQCYIFHRLLRA